MLVDDDDDDNDDEDLLLDPTVAEVMVFKGTGDSRKVIVVDSGSRNEDAY